MFIERLLNQGSAPLLAQTLSFTSSRAKLIAENLANVDTPGYRQKDLSVPKFQAMLRDRVRLRESAGPGAVAFDDVAGRSEQAGGILFYDNNNRSVEQIVTAQAQNAMMHNLAVELLRKQYQGLETALRERI